MTNGGKVIHVSDELHARLRRFCEENGVTMKRLVEKTLARILGEPHDDEPARNPPDSTEEPAEEPVPELPAAVDEEQARSDSTKEPVPERPSPAEEEQLARPVWKRSTDRPARVRKKSLQRFDDGTGDEPWSRPPFWHQDGKKTA